MTSLRRRWPILLLFCVLSFNATGIPFGIGAIFTDIMDTFEVSRATASLVQAMCIGFLYLFGIITGPFVRTQGPRVTVITGSVLGTAGCLVAFLATHIVQVIVGLGVMSGIGMSLNYLSSQIMAGILFYDMKSFALTATSISLASGAACYSLIYRHVTNYYSVRGTFLILASINCQMILCGAVIGLLAPRTSSKTAGTTESGKETESAGDDKYHGNSQTAGDGDQDCGGPLKESRNGESVRFIAEVQDEASSDGFLNCTVIISHEGKTDSVHGESEMSAPYKCSDCDLKNSKNDSNSHSVQEKVLPGTQVNEPDPGDSLLPTTNKIVCGAEDAVHADHTNEAEKRCLRCFSCHSLGQFFQLDIFRDVCFSIFAVFGTSCYIFLTQPIMFMTDMAKSNGLSPDDGSFFITISYVGNLVGRSSSGFVYRALQSRVVFATTVCMVTGGLACLMFVFTTEYVHFVAMSFTYGLSFGLMASLLPMTFLELLGPGRFAAGIGFTSAMAGSYTILAGPFGGLVRDLTTSYEPVFYIAIVYSVFAASLLLFAALRFHRRRQRCVK